MSNQTIITSCCIAALIALGCGGDKKDEEDTTTDTGVDAPDTAVDTEEDTEEDAPADVPTDGGCPADDATHIYINVAGQVQHLAGGDASGLYVAAISPLDALTNPTPTPIGTSTTGTGGVFAMDCINVKNVALGLVILVDDDPEDGVDGTFFPTGTGVKGWDTDVEKVDVLDATPFAVPNTVIAGLEAGTSIDPDAIGVVMGLILDGTAHTPIDEAVVTRADGTDAPVVYPTADFMGLETDGNTSANGSYVFDIDTALTLSNFTAEATGYTFGEHQAASKAGFCYFMIITSE
jgi:hypothetical protein